MDDFLNSKMEKMKINQNHPKKCFDPFYFETKEMRESKKYKILKIYRINSSFMMLPNNLPGYFLSQIKTSIDTYNVHMCKYCHRVFFSNSTALNRHLKDEHRNVELPSNTELDDNEKLKFEIKAKVYSFVCFILLLSSYKLINL